MRSVFIDGGDKAQRLSQALHQLQAEDRRTESRESVSYSQEGRKIMTFQEEIITLALAIARQQRNENHLQEPSLLLKKYLHERDAELPFAENAWDELPDVMYYAVCLAAYDMPYALNDLTQHVLPRYNVMMEQVQAACLAKYRRRAAGMPKDIEAERAAILAAIGEKDECR